jgi:predicted outer membrane repeat protein
MAKMWSRISHHKSLSNLSLSTQVGKRKFLKLLGYFVILCILLCAMLTPWQVASAAPVIFVRIDGHDSLCTGTVDAAYPGSGSSQPCAKQTIQAGVDAVDTGGTVNVRLGSFAGGISITDDLTLQGAGTDLTIIDGGNITPGLTIGVGTNVYVRDLIIQNGLNTIYGGGIRNQGTLELQDCIVQNNSAPGGGGIFSDQSITINRCRINDNLATSFGGGGLYIQAPLTMVDTTIHANTVNSHIALGGGMLLETETGEAVIIRRTTISENTDIVGGMIGGGGGIYLTADELAYFANVTISGNTTDFTGGGIVVAGAAGAYFQNSTIADNNSPASTVGGVLTYSETRFSNTIVAGNDSFQCGQNFGGTNLTVIRNISSDTSCGFTFKGDMQNTDPLLGPLQDNGGYTQTMALLTSSPAIDAGGNTICDFIYVGGVDQRGWPRPIDADLDGSAICDIGAFEAPPPYQLWLPLIMR